MILLRSNAELRSWRDTMTGSIGFVPTMGALHEGHASLLKAAKAENQCVILSIFVNPTQFNNKDDYEKYPLTLERDLKLAEDLKVDAVFLPNYAELYPDEYKYKISESDFSKKLCGAHRPGHFDGVLTVVMKLLNLVSPHKAYFGEKDHQQLTLVQGMVKAFFLPYEIIPVATIRDSNGLALSSRNMRLSAADQEKASLIYKTITQAKNTVEASELLTKNGFLVDYVEDIGDRRYVAVTLASVRLIDNVRI